MKKKIIVVVLGNRLNNDGTITEVQKQRLLMALEIEKQFNPDYYILSGGLANKKAGITEAEAMYNYLINLGFEKEKLILEDKSLTTVQNAIYSVAIAKKLGAEVLIVCTSGYHLADVQYKAMESFVNELYGSGIALMTYSR